MATVRKLNWFEQVALSIVPSQLYSSDDLKNTTARTVCIEYSNYWVGEDGPSISREIVVFSGFASGQELFDQVIQYKIDHYFQNEIHSKQQWTRIWFDPLRFFRGRQ